MVEGYGYMMVVAVGAQTFKGNIQRLRPGPLGAFTHP
jgi:hypothetical protein